MHAEHCNACKAQTDFAPVTSTGWPNWYDPLRVLYDCSVPDSLPILCRSPQSRLPPVPPSSDRGRCAQRPAVNQERDWILLLGGCESAKRWEPMRLLLSEWCMLGDGFSWEPIRELLLWLVGLWSCLLQLCSFYSFRKMSRNQPLEENSAKVSCTWQKGNVICMHV